MYITAVPYVCHILCRICEYLLFTLFHLQHIVLIYYFSYTINQQGQLAWTILTLALVVTQTRAFFYSIYNGLIWFFLPFTLVVCNDT